MNRFVELPYPEPTRPRMSHREAGLARCALVLLILLSLATPAEAYSYEGACHANFHTLRGALLAYKEQHGSFPEDIHDAQGRPLLSWRVRLIPYLSSLKLTDFRLDEAWDSPHNERFIEHVPDCLRCPPARRLDKGLTSRLRVKMVAKAFGPNAPTSVPIVEVDAEHAVVWTKPEDLSWDPATPHEGLARWHVGGYFRERGCFALLADNSVRFLPASAPDEFLRALLVDGPESTRPGYTWYEALSLPRINRLIGPYLLLGFIAVSGLVLFLPRLLTRKPLTPGEMLWLITGASVVGHAIAIVAWYRYDPIPPFRSKPEVGFWVLPALAGSAMSAIAVFKFRSHLRWCCLFTINLLIFAMIAWAAAIKDELTAEASFVSGVSPIWLACLAISTAWMTRPWSDAFLWPGRRLAHWAGICVTLLPFVWLSFCFSQGLGGFEIFFTRQYE